MLPYFLYILCFCSNQGRSGPVRSVFAENKNNMLPPNELYKFVYHTTILVPYSHYILCLIHLKTVSLTEQLNNLITIINSYNNENIEHLACSLIQLKRSAMNKLWMSQFVSKISCSSRDLIFYYVFLRFTMMPFKSLKYSHVPCTF